MTKIHWKIDHALTSPLHPRGIFVPHTAQTLLWFKDLKQWLPSTLQQSRLDQTTLDSWPKSAEKQIMPRLHLCIQGEHLFPTVRADLHFKKKKSAGEEWINKPSPLPPKKILASKEKSHHHTSQLFRDTEQWLPSTLQQKAQCSPPVKLMWHRSSGNSEAPSKGSLSLQPLEIFFLYQYPFLRQFSIQQV